MPNKTPKPAKAKQTKPKPRNTKAMLQELWSLAHQHGCAKDVAAVLNHPEFSTWTAAPIRELHHFGKGGLIEHTLEVTKLSMAMAYAMETPERHIDRKVLCTAAIWHDFGKIWDYRPLNKSMTKWESTSNKYRVYHIVTSAFQYKKSLTSDTPFSDSVTHCILAHHGRHEWKSPSTPQTTEAWILHLADMGSARINEVNAKQRNNQH